MNSTSGTTASRQFKKLLLSEQLEFICEAHNGVSAKIVQEAGFPGIWASGLSISAHFGVRDNNEASWTQVLENLEFMSDATTIPIFLDGDTGYGNFNNMQRLVRKLEQRHIAAVCIEDKLFPKTNSFINGGAQPLADMQEFCGKIKAGKDAQTDRDSPLLPEWRPSSAAGDSRKPCVEPKPIIRLERTASSFIAPCLCPMKSFLFKQEWGNRCPVVIVPTKYYATPTDVFRQHGFSMVIWANHMLRAAVTAMQKTARTLKKHEHLLSIEDKVVPVSEIFRLQNAAELQEAEDRYLPRYTEDTCAIVLAASRGYELGELTEHQPKTMVNIQGTPILSHIVDAYNAVGIKDIIVVRGYKKRPSICPNLTYVDNNDFAETGELDSLLKALQSRNGHLQTTIISYGDVLFNKYIPQSLCQEKDNCVIFIDSNWKAQPSYIRLDGFAECTIP